MLFTPSRDGLLRATVRVEHRVPHKLFDWLSRRIGKVRAEREIRRVLKEEGRLFLELRTVAVDPEGGDVIVIMNKDPDVAYYRERGWDIYDPHHRN